MEGIIKITSDREKAKSMLKMVETSIEMVKTIDRRKFPSNIIKEYYDIIRELISIILLMDGYKTLGEGAHKKLIEYLQANYKQCNQQEIMIIDDLRVVRNKIAYDGFFVTEDYAERRVKDVVEIIAKLKAIIKERLK